MGWRERRGLASPANHPQYPQNPDRQTRTDNFEGFEGGLSDLKSHKSVVAELSPIVPFDEISKIVDGLEAQFLGIKPAGWLSELDSVSAPLSVLEEVARSLADLDRHGWSREARRRLLARLQPGDTILKVADDFLLVAAERSRETRRIWRADS